MHNHLILPDEVHSSHSFSSTKTGGGGAHLPERDKDAHSRRLEGKFAEVWSIQSQMKEQRSAVSLPTRSGAYIEFRGQTGHELMVSSLEDQKSGIRLLNVRQIQSENGENMQAATVFVPAGKEHKFANKLQEYKTQLTKKGKPSHDSLFRSVEDLSVANLRALWTDKVCLFPSDVENWYEVWIRTSVSEDKGQAECEAFMHRLLGDGYECKSEYLLFYERAVILVRANQQTLSEMIASYDCLAEFRSASTLASFWCGESQKEQGTWVRDLLQRMVVDQNHEVLVCMLDSGINNGHPLLQPLISDDYCHTSIIGAGSHDPGTGHGTQMAGIIEYGNLEEALESSGTIRVSNRLCSIKILPNSGRNTPDMYGPVTEQSVYRAELYFPSDNKFYCMAVTAANSDDGLPSSWSGTVDKLAFGDGKNTRLMVLSAGNIRNEDINIPIWDNYPSGSSLRPVQDPAQSWNALTIGAYTELVAPGVHPEFDRVASLGELSPFSTTSVSWKSNTPIKPEVVFEGGNLYRTHRADVPYTSSEELERLTTRAQFHLRGYFDTISATSLATALASAKISMLLQRYPSLWPETVRALVVHSAVWSEAMERQFPARTKTELKARLRCVGYGVPDETRLFNSLDNALTLIAQDQIQPFIKRGTASPIMNEMHLYEMPWPTDILIGLGEVPVKIKVTLSYFIEPSPGQIGWTNKYRYQSCGLRFEVNDVNESKEEFEQRVNLKMRDADDEQSHTANSSRWVIGSNNRDVGSIHSDFITDSAINLSGCRYVAVYPVGGWWKTRTNLKMYNQKVRYSLVVSLETENESVDLYSEVATQIENMVNVPVEVRTM